MFNMKKSSKKKESSDDGSVSTARSSLKNKMGQHLFDRAVKVRIRDNLRSDLRLAAERESKSWVIDIATSYDYYPFRLQTRTGDEIRWRILGATSGAGSEVAIFDVEMGNTLRLVNSEGAVITTIAISRPLAVDRVPPVIAIGSSSGRIYIFCTMTGDSLLHPRMKSYVHPGPINSIAINEGALLYMFLASEHVIYGWDFDKGVLKEVWDTYHTESIKKLWLHYEIQETGSEIRYLISVGDDLVINIFNVKELTFVRSFKGFHKACICSVVTHAAKDHSYLASGGRDGMIQIFDLRTSEHLMTINLPNKDSVLSMEVINLRYNPALLSAGQSGLIYVFDLKDGTLLSSLPAHAANIRSLKFVKEPHWFMISGGYDSIVKLWDLELMCGKDPANFGFVSSLRRREEAAILASSIGLGSEETDAQRMSNTSQKLQENAEFGCDD